MSDKQRRFEIVMVILTGLGKLLFVDVLNIKFIFITAVIGFWISYFIIKVSKNKQLIKFWGLSFSNSKETFKIVTIAGLIVMSAFLIYGIYNDSLRFQWSFIIILLIYPMWGLVQQFLMMSLFAGNLKDYQTKHFSKPVIIILTSILFSIIHFPSVPLILATFIMAIIYSIIFLKERNIIPLGIIHGLLGAVFYYVVLNRNAWLEFIAILN